MTTIEADVGRKPWKFLTDLTKYWEAGLPPDQQMLWNLYVSQFHSLAGNYVVARHLPE